MIPKPGPLAYIAIAGWLGALLAGNAWLGAREDLATERERCNVDKLEEVLEQERMTSQTIIRALERDKARETQLAASLAIALERSQGVARQADNAAAEAVAAMESFTDASPENCADQLVPRGLADSVRRTSQD